MSVSWRTLLPPPVASGTLKSQPQDFVVDELPAYEPSGQGEHLFLQVEKTGWTTEQLIRDLARHLDIPRAAIGAAGLKDRHAVTRQWLSIPASAEQGLATFERSGIRILSQARHGNKLKTGHLRGNAFHIRIRNLSPNAKSDLDERIARLRESGFPNYFGGQRFGRDGDNAEQGRAILEGKGRKVDKRTLRLLISAVQSSLFNDLLAARIEGGLFEQILAGDVLIKSDSGGRFVCQDPETDQTRFDRHEIHPSGPLFGPKMVSAQGLPGEMENRALQASGLTLKHFGRFAKIARGARRPLRVSVPDLEHEFATELLELRFQLPAGSYATALIREIINGEDASS